MWQTFSTILNAALGLLTLYFYFENRKLKGFELEKEIAINQNESKELIARQKREKDELMEKLATGGQTGSGIGKNRLDEMGARHNRELLRQEIELLHLHKLKRYRWLFSK